MKVIDDVYNRYGKDDYCPHYGLITDAMFYHYYDSLYTRPADQPFGSSIARTL